MPSNERVCQFWGILCLENVAFPNQMSSQGLPLCVHVLRFHVLSKSKSFLCAFSHMNISLKNNHIKGKVINLQSQTISVKGITLVSMT